MATNRASLGPTPLFGDGERPAVLGAWMIGGRAAGLGVREDASSITRDTSHVVPRVVVG